MKYLKKFEAFDLGRFSENGEEENDWINDVEELDSDCETCGDQDELFDDHLDDEVDEEGDDIESRRRVWGDELVEGLTAKQKKLPKALQDAILKKQGKKSDKDNKSQSDKEKDKKKSDDKKSDSKKGLTAKQKKLPKALQDAILKKHDKK